MNIRKVEEKDIPQVLNLLLQVLEIHRQLRPDIFNENVTKYSYEDILEMIDDEDRPVFVMVENDKVLGYAFCEIRVTKYPHLLKKQKGLYLSDLCVDEKCRRQGVGEALLKYVIEYAKSRGCQELTLNSWADNDPANNFYKKMGLKVRASTFEYLL